MNNGMRNRAAFVKPRPGELWREMNNQVVEIVDAGMKYATVKAPGGDPRFKRMVKFTDFAGKFEPEPVVPPRVLVRPSEDVLNEEFLQDE